MSTKTEPLARFCTPIFPCKWETGSAEQNPDRFTLLINQEERFWRFARHELSVPGDWSSWEEDRLKTLKSAYQNALNKGWRFLVSEELTDFFPGLPEGEMPRGLWVHSERGLTELPGPRVAIVGTRRPT